MTLIERVARAIAVGTAHDPDAPILDEGPLWKQMVPAAEMAIAVVIEECAQVLKQEVGDRAEIVARVAAIRALKEKP